MTLLVFGPFGVYLSNTVAACVQLLMAHGGVVTGASMTFLVMLGLHCGIVPVVLSNLAVNGDHIAAMWTGCTFAQIGVAAGIFIKSHNVLDKNVSGAGVLMGLLAGVTEPIVYGLLMKYKRTLSVVVVCGAIGGAINGYFKVKMTSFAFQSLLSVPVFKPALFYLIGISVAFFSSMLITLIIRFDSDVTEKVKFNS